MDSIVYKNVLAWRGCEKLYLDTITSDVFFIFRSENNKNIEKVPAHKCILSANSPVFGALFYGSHKQDGDIDISDATPEAFKEFLQFFYRNQVKLKTENFADAMILCQRYQLDDWQTVLHACSDISKSMLTLDKICWGYELAILSESNELKTFCEEEIRKNATEIFRSNSFLKCQPNLLRHILQLDSLKCNESEVFDGCIAWAKAECLRKGCDENVAQNLRAQLGDLFYEIRFGEMTHTEFQHLYRTWVGVFTSQEFCDITMMITSKDFRPVNFNRCPRLVKRTPEPVCVEGRIELICHRAYIYARDFPNRDSSNETGSLETTFTSTSELLLEKFELVCDFKTTLQIAIYEDSTEGNCKIAFGKIDCGRHVGLSSPILIKANIKYRIVLLVPHHHYGFNDRLEKIVKMEDGTLIEFGDENPYITRLHFIKNERKQMLSKFFNELLLKNRK